MKFLFTLLMILFSFMGVAHAADYDFTLATNEAVLVVNPLSEAVPTNIWTSAEVGQGTTYSNCKVYVTYEAFVPDTSLVSPYNFEVIALVEQEQSNGSWQEIGRQNMPIRRLNQGPVREILVSPISNSEEGIDQTIAGFGGVPVRQKSVFKGSCEGTIRVSMWAVDYNPVGLNPFQGVTFSITGQRFD